MKINIYKTLNKVLIIILSFGVLIIIFQSIGIDIDQDITWFLKINKDSQRSSDVKQIKKALEAYHQDNGHYPVGTTMCSSWHEERENVKYIPDLEAYLPELPNDPEEKIKSAPDYCYESIYDGSDYVLTNYYAQTNKEIQGRYLKSTGKYVIYGTCGKDEDCTYFYENYSPEKAIVKKDDQRLEDIKILKKALEAYHQDNGHYPVGTTMCSSWHEEGENVKYIPDLEAYLPELPNDPEEKIKSAPDYCYTSVGESYNIQYYLIQRNLDKNPGEEHGESGQYIRYIANN